MHSEIDRSLRPRAAELADAEALADVAIDSFADDPAYELTYPHRYEFPDDHRRWMVQKYREYLEQPEKYVVMYASSSNYRNRPVAVIVWDLDVRLESRGGGQYTTY